MKASPALKLVAPHNVKRTVTPKRRRNGDLRTREYLTEREVERLIEAARDNRWGHRDSTMVLIAFRHGLRASELIDLRWEQIDLKGGVLHVRRVKQGTPATHPLTGRELRALRRLEREAPGSRFVFVSERAAPFRAIWATSRSSTRCATLSCLRHALRAYSAISACKPHGAPK